MKKGTKSGRGTGNVVAKEAAVASTGAKARGEALIALIQRRVARITEDFYDIGIALREIVHKKLYKPMGFATLDAMLASRKLMSAAQARKLVAIVEHVKREDALNLGQEKAYALVAYTEATPEPDSPGQLIEAGTTFDGRSVAKASVKDIKRAASAVRAKSRSSAHATPAARERARTEREALRNLRAGLKRIGLGRAKIEAGPKLLRVVVTIEDAAAMRAE